MNTILFKRVLGAGVVIALAAIILPFLLQGEGYRASLRTDIPERPQAPEPLDTGLPDLPSEVREKLVEPPPLPVPKPPSEVKPAAIAADDPMVKELRIPPEQSVASQNRPVSNPAPEVKQAGAKHAPRPGQWLIQLGSFSDEANALTLQSRLRAAGMDSYIEALKIDGRPIWRVRAGPFATKEQADAALKRLQGRLKLGGIVMQVR